MWCHGVRAAAVAKATLCVCVCVCVCVCYREERENLCKRKGGEGDIKIVFIHFEWVLLLKLVSKVTIIKGSKLEIGENFYKVV